MRTFLGGDPDVSDSRTLGDPEGSDSSEDSDRAEQAGESLGEESTEEVLKGNCAAVADKHTRAAQLPKSRLGTKTSSEKNEEPEAGIFGVLFGNWAQLAYIST